MVVLNRVCSKCGTFGSEDLRLTQIHEHHVLPQKGWEGQESRKILLCEKCHNIIHHIISTYVGIKLKQVDKKIWLIIKDNIEKFTLWWVNQRGEK